MRIKQGILPLSLEPTPDQAKMNTIVRPGVFLALIFLLNVSYVLIYQQKSVFILISFAMALFIVCLVLPKKVAWRQGYESVIVPVVIYSGRHAMVLLLPFIIPVVFYFIPVQIIFWKFGAVGKITLSWFLFSVLLLNLTKQRNADKELTNNMSISAMFWLFIIWSGMLWLNLIWDAGAGSLAQKNAANGEHLSTIFKIWENKPFSTHFGLTFFFESDYANNIAYGGHNPIYVFLMYLYVKTIQLLGNVSMEFATKFIPFFYSSLLITVIAFFLFQTKDKAYLHKLSVQVTLFLGLGFILSLPDFWVSLLKYNTDNYMPLIMCFILGLFAFVINVDLLSKWFVTLFYLLCLLFPTYGVICIITLCFFLSDYSKFNIAKRKQDITKILGIGLIIALLSYLYPPMIIKALGYKNMGSTLIFRSGLDGDTTYYKNIFQAFVNPYARDLIRPWSSILPTIILAVFTYAWGGYKILKLQPTLLECCIFLFSPYLFSLVFFPQAVSIHPYIYDYLAVLPLAFISIWLLISSEIQDRLEGLKAYLFFLILSALVLHNLTSISQAAR